MTTAIPKYYLYPSTLFAQKEGHMVTTVLGSCVAVCLYDETTGLGGINHYMLPFWNGNELASPKYGNIAIESLVKKLEKLGVQRNNMVAKVFGGANQLNHTIGVGQRNIKVAQEMLEELNIKIVAKSVGGEKGRKINFNTSTGEVFMKYVTKQGD
ncbi:MAG: chemotaxis protein CheD [Cyclobacteriaceae bacterium]|nr:chemotaxis protein CheD [Cyclobacteriaceae bacterium]